MVIFTLILVMQKCKLLAPINKNLWKCNGVFLFYLVGILWRWFQLEQIKTNVQKK